MNNDIQIGDIVQLKEEPNRWGVVTGFSDDGSTVYYNPRGASFTRIAVPIDKVEKDNYSHDV